MVLLARNYSAAERTWLPPSPTRAPVCPTASPHDPTHAPPGICCEVGSVEQRGSARLGSAETASESDPGFLGFWISGFLAASSPLFL